MKKTDFDLDVMNALNDFPKNNEDSYIYVRVQSDEERDFKEENGDNYFINTSGTMQGITTALVTFAAMSEDSKDIFLNATLNFLNNNPNEIDRFKDYLKDI